MRGRAAQAALMAARGWSPAAQPAVRCTVLPAGSAQVASRPARPVSGSYSNVASGSTTSPRRRRKVTLHKLAQLHNRGEPIVMITAYDVFAGRVAEAAQADILLVGDSLGMVVCGRESTVDVSLEEVRYHCQAVKAGAKTPFLVADLPFGTYLTPEDASRNAAYLLKSANAEGIKMEGGRRVLPQIEATVAAGIPTMGHVGLTPQTVSALSGFCYQGKTADAAMQLLDDSLALQEAGCFAIVLECVPGEVSEIITAALDIPTIGIGAGPRTSGQVQVFHDILGMFPRPPKFSRKFAPMGDLAESATATYVDAVRTRAFPAVEHTFSMNESEHEKFLDLVGRHGSRQGVVLLSRGSPPVVTPVAPPPREIKSVAVVGAGSLGLLVAGKLAAEGVVKVYLVDHATNQCIDAVNARGGVVVKDLGEAKSENFAFEGFAGAFTSVDDTIAASGLADLVIVSVKSNDTVAAAEAAARLCHPEGTIVSVQNGDNLDALSAAVGSDRLVVGSTTLAANKVDLAAGSVNNANPRGVTSLAAVATHGRPRAEAVASLFAASGLGSCTVDGSGPDAAAKVVWQKLAVNAVINPLTALLEVENGRLVDLEASRELARSLASEFLAVATAKGLALPWSPESLHLAAEDVARATAPNKSSMLADILRGTPTEIEAINGRVVDEASRLGVPVPTHKSMLTLVRAKEELQRAATSPEMEILTTVDEVRRFRSRHAKQTIGMVPTMGGLHAGHMNLMEAATRQCDLAIASLFVNPKQFAPTEDLDVYPRQTQIDLDMLREAGAAAVFMPDREAMYPEDYATQVDIEGIDTISEGAARPGFFGGVATVCTKLFNIAQPDKVFFGQKDGLQCMVIRRIVQDLNIPTEVVVCPTAREASGLALSTRNQYLTDYQRQRAPVLFRALSAGNDMFTSGESNNRDTIVSTVQSILESDSIVDSVQYVSLADSRGREVEVATPGCMLSAAVKIVPDGDAQSVRILDNVIFPERR